MLQSGGTHQRNINIAPSRGNAQINRESAVISPRNGAQSEPVSELYLDTSERNKNLRLLLFSSAR